jgi:regulator of ribonuclease activity A
MKTADLVDDHDERVALCDLPWRRFGRVRSFWGPIATVRCCEDNALLKRTLQERGDGRVMVVDGGGSTRRALIGDQIAAILAASGWAGIVINGAIRDSAEIDAMPVGVFCLGTTPKKSAKDGAGEQGVPVAFGGVEFRPGAFVYCDADGVLVSADALLARPAAPTPPRSP